jgi:hypothetical protein
MAQYTTVLANEFNAVRNTVATVLGTGSGTRGYGSPVTSYTVAAGNNIGVAEFTALKTDINCCYNHITNGNATLNSIVAGGQITWANLVSYQTAATYIDTNRDTIAFAASASPFIGSANLPAGWGNASGNRVATANFTLTFTNTEAMRFYFNQGGIIRMSSGGSASGGSAKSNAWGALANSMSNQVIQSDYRAGTGRDSNVNLGVTPYNQGATPDGMTFSLSFNGNLLQGYIQCRDKGSDGNVASNVDIPLTFYFEAVTVSNTTGITTYIPSISFGNWSYSA